jgi:DNA polymerase-1
VQLEAGFDSETHVTQPGIAAPPIVVGSICEEVGKERLLYPEEVVEWLRARLSDGTRIVGAHIVYDFGVACALDPTLIPLVFDALERDDVEDVLINDALLEIGRGSFEFMHGLDDSVEKNLGEHLEKENTWRLRYGELDGIPFEEWSEDARDYPRKDARAPLRVWRKQNEVPKKTVPMPHVEGCPCTENEWANCTCPHADPFGGGGYTLEPDPQEPGYLNLDLAPYENRAAWALQLMSIWGIRTDPEMVGVVTREVTQQHEETQKRFGEAGIFRLQGWCRRLDSKKNPLPCGNPNPHLAGPKCKPWPASQVGSKDTSYLKALVVEAYGGEPPMTAGTDKNAPTVSTDQDTLKESGNDLLFDLGEAGPNEKDFSQYLKVVALGTQWPINVDYNLILKTCRTSCRSPNLQNMPRAGRSRECFVPRDFRDPDPAVRKVLCSTDFPSLELWTLAEACLGMLDYSELALLLRAGTDVHTKLASLVLRIPYEEAIARKKAGDKTVIDRRQDAKPVNYGLGGGMSDESLVLNCRKQGTRFCLGAGAAKCGVENVVGTKGKATGRPLCAACLEQARVFIRAWHEMLPEMRDYFRVVQDEVSSGIVTVPAPDGLPVLFCADRGRNESFNLKFQGPAARAAKDGIYRVSRACYKEPDSPLFGCRPALFVHDDLITEMAEPHAHESAFEQARLMGEALQKWCPRVYNEHACPKPALGRRWFKGWEEVFDRAGRLVPWWPKRWEWEPDQEIMSADLLARARG